MGRWHLYHCLIINILENVHGFPFWLEREALEGSYQKVLVKTTLSGRNPIRKFTVQKIKWFMNSYLLSPVPCLYPVGKMALASISAFLSTMSPFSHSPPHWVYFCCRCPLEFFYLGPRMTQISSFAANKAWPWDVLCVSLSTPVRSCSTLLPCKQSMFLTDTRWVQVVGGRGDTVVASGEPSFSVTHSPSLRSSSPFIPLKISLDEKDILCTSTLHSQELSGSLALCP